MEGIRGNWGCRETAAAVAPVVRVGMARMVRRELLGPRPAVFLVCLGLLPPAELGKYRA